MKNSFINLIREPDSVLFQFEDSILRFEEPDSREEERSRLDYKVVDNCGVITLYPSERPVKRIKLRWRGDMSDVLMILGDAYERNYDLAFGSALYAAWRAVIPEQKLPWYFHAYDGERLNSFGVKTGPDAICYFQCDESGITLWLDVRNGNGGVYLTKPLVLAKVVCREGEVGENPYEVSKIFCRAMCDNPILPKSPVFGVNNWYWAYGNISHDTVMNETDNLMDMCRDAVCSPYMILDDGWQCNRYRTAKGEGYNGGPWNAPNANFESMEETAYRISEKGARPGIWFRPLLASQQLPASYESPFQSHKRGIILDPTNPEVLDMIARDVRTINGWGYKLIKHDFTTYDTTGLFDTLEDGDVHFYDKTVTNCTMLKNLFSTIQDAAGDAEVMGCNTANHLVAGIHSLQRTGHDTSGNSYEITRIAAAAAMLRLPQNNTFFNVDPDCAAFTNRVPIDANLDFMELCAITGSVTLASATPGLLKGADLERARGIYKIASLGGIGATPTDWLAHNAPSRYKSVDGKTYKYDWYKVYDGVRNFYTWLN